MDVLDLARLVNAYDDVKQSRLHHDRESRKLKELEDSSKAAIIEHLLEHNMTSTGTELVQASLVEKDTVIVEDWEAFYAYITGHEAFDVLYRMINQKAVRERMEEEGVLPGTSQVRRWDLSESRANLPNIKQQGTK